MGESVLRLIKIDIGKPSNEEINTSISKAFNDINTYFRRTIKGNKIYVGKRLHPDVENQLKQRISYISPIGKSVIARSVLKKQEIDRDRDKTISPSKASNLPSIKSYSNSTINLNSSLPDIKYQVSDAELNQLFENIKQKTEKNSSNINDFVDQLEEPHLKNIFHLQEETLRKQEEYMKYKENIEIRLLKLTKKTPETLLLNQVGQFRVMKELKASSDEYHSDNQSNVFKWTMNLRTEKKFVGTRKAMINMGSEMKPNWAIIYDKIPKVKEKIRQFNDKDSWSQRSLSCNRYRDRKSIYEKMKDSFDEFQGLSVEGKSLLQWEIDQIKGIAGRKKMIRKVHEDYSDKATQVIASNLSLKNIFDVKTINSCMKIHQV